MSDQQPHEAPVVAHTPEEDDGADSALSWFGGALLGVAFAVFVWTPWGASQFGDGDNTGRRAGFKNLIDDLGQSGVTAIALGVAVLFTVVGAFTLRAERRDKA
ncbi:hypothetical protein [Aeromicrobium massiliense]|uniref:hypothetical protein n=1 Tax=Aeromicrobium massiliense TaxID=1464554 RepID=UPI00031E1420|nr:hypothetical protein [Aeromicrobium massiliense]